VIKGTIDLSRKQEEQMEHAAKRGSTTEGSPIGESEPVVPQEPQSREPEVVVAKAVPEPESGNKPEETVAKSEETKEHITDEL